MPCSHCLHPDKECVFQFQDYKLVFRRYAHLYFIMCLDMGDNELAALEAIHLFVEILDHFFTSVTELDIVLNFHKVRISLAREYPDLSLDLSCPHYAQVEMQSPWSAQNLPAYRNGAF